MVKKFHGVGFFSFFRGAKIWKFEKILKVVGVIILSHALCYSKFISSIMGSNLNCKKILIFMIEEN